MRSRQTLSKNEAIKKKKLSTLANQKSPYKNRTIVMDRHHRDAEKRGEPAVKSEVVRRHARRPVAPHVRRVAGVPQLRVDGWHTVQKGAVSATDDLMRA